MRILIADEALEEVPPGEEGELLVAGPQVTLGYWRDPEKTAAAFVSRPGPTVSTTGPAIASGARRMAGGR